MAPFFGASTIVWANTIGGRPGRALGRLLARRAGSPTAARTCAASASSSSPPRVLLAVVPFVARPFFDVSVDALDQIEAGAFVGSLLGGPGPGRDPGRPARHLRAVGAAARGRRRRARRAVAGRLYAISTVGSLTGTMLAALVLIPLAGTQRTFLVFALALALVAAVGLGWRFVVVPARCSPARSRCRSGTVKAVDEGRVLYEDESDAAVHPGDRGARRRPRRWSSTRARRCTRSCRPGGYLTADYWDSFLVLPFAATRPAAAAGRDPRQRRRARSRASTATSGRGPSVDGGRDRPGAHRASATATSTWARTRA